MDAIDAIQRRTSVRRYRSDPVSRETIELLLDCAVRAPNHKLTEPWRFAVLTGDAKARFAEIRARHRLKRYDDPESDEARAGADKVRRETLETPSIIIIMTRLHEDEVMREEDYAAVMMATANLMTAAQSLNLGTYLKDRGRHARARTRRSDPTSRRLPGRRPALAGVSGGAGDAPAAASGPGGHGLDLLAGVGCYGSRVFELCSPRISGFSAAP